MAPSKADATPWIAYTDGASRGNPGAAAFAFVLTSPDGATIEDSGCLGDTTNNVAEYTGLLRALTRLGELGATHLNIFSDSELLVKQMNGEYRVKDAKLAELFQEAKELCSDFEKVTIRHVRREQNKRADALCNEALDGRS